MLHDGVTALCVIEGTGVRAFARALAEGAEGRMRPVIGRTFPLERAAETHAAIEAREVVGKTFLLT